MYDRKKITLFVLLIATVILGGVSLFLATQINQNQSPDDSQAGNGVCSLKYTGLTDVCSSKTTQVDCLEASQTIDAATCCSLDSSNNCNSKTGRPQYCSLMQCADRSPTNCTSGSVPAAGSCQWANTYKTCNVGGDIVEHNATVCSSGTFYKCNDGTANMSGCCNGYVSQGGFCVPGSTPGTTTGGTNTGGSASCTEQGEEISHGNTACINGTNYTCNNGTATPGSSCGTTDPGTSGGGTTGSSCTPENPTKAKLLSPLANAVVNTTTITLSWDKNGSFGVACPTNDNKYRVKLLAVGLNEACPTSSLDVPSLEGHIVGGTGEGGIFNYQINVQDDTKYCWAIRKNNGDTVADTAVRSFTVNIEETNPTTGGGGGDDGTGTTTSEPVEPTPGTGSNATSTTGGTVTGAIASQTGSVASASDELPETAIVSDELDPILLGMFLVIIGLTLYKFDFGRKAEIE